MKNLRRAELDAGLMSLVLAILLLCPIVASSNEAGLLNHATAEASGIRHVGMQVREGTSVNIDISPDGGSIVFDLLGDIYVMDRKGGDARLVSGGAGWDSWPVWSPDGTKIAFISDRSGQYHLHYLDLKTHDIHQVTNTKNVPKGIMVDVIRSVEWMPDSMHLASVGNVYSLDGSLQPPVFDEHLVLPDIELRPCQGASCFYYAKRDLDGGNQEVRRYDVRKETSKVVFKPSEKQFILAPVVSADERLVIYETCDGKEGEMTNATIRVRDMSNGRDRRIAPTGSPRAICSRHKTRYAITPDSEWLVIGLGGKIKEYNLTTGREKDIPFVVSVNQDLEPIAIGTYRTDEKDIKVKYVRSSDLSPDGVSIAFSALNTIYVMDLATQRHRILVKQATGQFKPKFSPDGKWILFSTWDQVKLGDLWLISAQGGVPVNITNEPGCYLEPSWFPDGRSVAYIKASDCGEIIGFGESKGQVETISLDGHERKVLGVQARVGHPLTISSDSARIIYVRGDPAEGNGLESVSIQDGVVREEVSSEYLPYTPQARQSVVSVAPSPDGKYIAVVMYGNLYVAETSRLAPFGKDAVYGYIVDQNPGVFLQITTDGAYDPAWKLGGDILTWTFANSFFQLRTSDIQATGVENIKSQFPEALVPKRRVSGTRIDITTPRSFGHGSLVLKGARLITMRGDEVIENSSLVIRDGRIVEIGLEGAVRVPADAAVVDVSGKTIIPGLFDLHGHLVSRPRETLASNWWDMLVYLAFGVTTIRDPSNHGVHAFGYEELIASGATVGPRIFGSEAIDFMQFKISNIEDARSLAHRSKALGANFIKGHTLRSREQRTWLAKAALEYQIHFVSHAVEENNIKGLRLNLSNIVDGSATVEHDMLSLSPIYDDVVSFMKESHAWFNSAGTAASYGGYPEFFWEKFSTDPRIRTFYLGSEPVQRGQAGLTARDQADYPPKLLDGEGRLVAESVFKLVRGGANVSAGSHGNYPGIGLHWEIWAYVRAGLSNYEALRTATIDGARGLGMEQDLGSIEIGKVADLLVLEADPLDNIENTALIAYVMKSGIMREASTLNQVWPTSEALPEWKRN